MFYYALAHELALFYYVQQQHVEPTPDMPNYMEWQSTVQVMSGVLGSSFSAIIF